MTRFLIAVAALAAAAYALMRRRRAAEGDVGEPGVRSWPDSPGTLETEGPRAAEGPVAPTAFPDDATLVARVESQLFRDPELPKGQINVDAAGGVVTLRGEVPRELVEEIGVRAAAVEGVVRVENLLHPPGEAPAEG